MDMTIEHIQTRLKLRAPYLTKIGILAESFNGECVYLNERLLSFLLLSLITGNAFLQEFDNEFIIS